MSYFALMNGVSRPPHVKRWYLKEWRLYRSLSQEALAEKIGTTKATISKLERYQLLGPKRGRLKINDEWVGVYCSALAVTQRELAEPPDTKRSIDDMLKDVPIADQKRFRALAEAFVKPDKQK